MSTSGDIMSTSGDVQYFGGVNEVKSQMKCSIHRRDTMSTSGDIMSTSGDIMSTSGDVQYFGGVS